MKTFFNVTALASMFSLFNVLFSSQQQHTASVSTECDSGYNFNYVMLRSQLDVSCDIYAQLQNKSLVLFYGAVPPGAIYNVSVTSEVRNSLISLHATVPGVPEIIYSSISLARNKEEYVFEASYQRAVRSRGVWYTVNHSSVAGRAHPFIRPVRGARTTCMAAKFRSLSLQQLDMWWDDGGEGVLSAKLKVGQETTTNTYEGHVFYFTLSGTHGANRVEVARFTMSTEKPVYTIRNYRDDPSQIPSNIVDLDAKEAAFMDKYLKATGIQYRHYYGDDGPRQPPTLYMHPADYVGQRHLVESPETLWHCDGPAQQCQTTTSDSSNHVQLMMEVISLKPRAFYIENFMSSAEAQHLIKLATPRVAESGVGDGATGVFKSSTRTSKNSWFSRSSSAIAESLYLRAADLLQIDERILQGTARNAVEDMQVVHYNPHEKYDAHHDWGVSGYPESRYLTLLLYLTDQEDERAGGETAFPKGGVDGNGIKVLPKEGSAVLFYDLLPDGNGDDLSVHASLPVLHGEKWLANFWVWDPFRRD